MSTWSVLHVRISTSCSFALNNPALLGMLHVGVLVPLAPIFVRRVRSGGLEMASADSSDCAIKVAWMKRTKYVISEDTE